MLGGVNLFTSSHETPRDYDRSLPGIQPLRLPDAISTILYQN